MDDQATMPLDVTQAAADHIKGLMTKQPEAVGLKLGTKTAGCSGLMYDLGFVTDPNPEDAVIEVAGVKVYVDQASLPYLKGTRMDWEEDKFATGFTFTNPNAKDMCGCGESFLVD